MPPVSVPSAKRGGLEEVWMRYINLIPESSGNLREKVVFQKCYFKNPLEH